MNDPTPEQLEKMTSEQLLDVAYIYARKLGVLCGLLASTSRVEDGVENAGASPSEAIGIGVRVLIDAVDSTAKHMEAEEGNS